MPDELLDKMVGTWRIIRQFPTRTAENTAKIEWVLADRWLRIEMTDAATPAGAAAHANHRDTRSARHAAAGTRTDYRFQPLQEYVLTPGT